MPNRARRLALAALSLTVLTLALPSEAATITFAGDRGNSCVIFAGTTGGTHTVAISSSNVLVGQTLIVTAGTTGNASLSSITDDAGNTYSSLNSWAVGGVGRVFHWGSTFGTQLNTTQNVSLNYATSAVGEISCVSVHAFTNVAGLPGSEDQTGGTNGNDGAPGATLGSSTTQMNELLVETHIINGAPGGIGGADNPIQIANSGTFWVIPFYRIVSTTGTFSMNETLGTAQPWQAVITSFKDVVAPVELQRFRSE